MAIVQSTYACVSIQHGSDEMCIVYLIIAALILVCRLNPFSNACAYTHSPVNSSAGESAQRCRALTMIYNNVGDKPRFLRCHHIAYASNTIVPDPVSCAFSAILFQFTCLRSFLHAL